MQAVGIRWRLWSIYGKDVGNGRKKKVVGKNWRARFWERKGKERDR